MHLIPNDELEAELAKAESTLQSFAAWKRNLTALKTALHEGGVEVRLRLRYGALTTGLIVGVPSTGWIAGASPGVLVAAGGTGLVVVGIQLGRSRRRRSVRH